LVDVSRLLSDVLDASFDDKSVLKRRYDLEVSSPGLDRPLTKASHFSDAIGEKIKMRLKSETEVGLRGVVGTLIEVQDSGVVIEPEAQTGERLSLSYKDMADAHIIFDFAKLDKNKKN
jgi:ribosome maturation factor RimP